MMNKRYEQINTYTTVEQVFKTEYDTREDITGYNVTYSLNGRESVVRMPYDPGNKIPLQNGQLDLTPPADKK